MRKCVGRGRPRGVAFVFWISLVIAGPAAWAQDLPEGDAERGEYVFQLAGCLGCHTDSANDGAPLAGGRILNTDFGSFVTPNITPDPEHGIGGWTLAEFDRALRDGIGPDGTTYYPSFPYDYFTGMEDQDVADLYAYLMAQPASDNAVSEHDLNFPFDMRFLLFFWRMLYFEPGPEAADPERDETWHRGRYLVDALGHCGACHTPRTWLGGTDTDLYLAGNGNGPDGDLVPNITPNIETGIGSWSELDMMLLLRAGLLPDGDAVGSDMAEVVRNSTRALSDEDAAALIAYLANIPPIDNRPVRGEP
ncbi:MAG: cytochrome c [Pseudomonadota bacterium]